jgi:hypothetical protein
MHEVRDDNFLNRLAYTIHGMNIIYLNKTPGFSCIIWISAEGIILQWSQIPDLVLVKPESKLRRFPVYTGLPRGSSLSSTSK